MNGEKEKLSIISSHEHYLNLQLKSVQAELASSQEDMASETGSDETESESDEKDGDEEENLDQWDSYLKAFEAAPDVTLKNNQARPRLYFLLRHFVNLGYKLALIPFRLEYVDEKTGFRIRENILQKILCLLLSSTASIACFSVNYGHIRGKSIENNPLIIFNFWSYSVFCWWCFLFTNIFWRNQNLILEIVNHEHNYANVAGDNGGNIQWGKWETKLATLYFFGVIIEELYHKSVFYLFPKSYNLSLAVEQYSGKALHKLFLKPSDAPIPYANLTHGELSIAIWHFAGWEIFGTIKSLVYILVTFTSLFLIEKIGGSFGRIKAATNNTQVWGEFLEIRSTVGRINGLSSLPTLGIYLILVPFLSSAIIKRWDSKFVEYKVLMILQFVWPMIALVLACEATRKAKKLLSLIKDKMEALNGENLSPSVHYIMENSDLSLTGGKFFRLSFTFLGQTLSVVMSYGLVILGFLHDADKRKHGMGTCRS